MRPRPILAVPLFILLVSAAQAAPPPKQLAYLLRYSPYHNVKEGVKYPALLLTAGERDERVHALHARKMAARLQAATSGDPQTRPILLWVERDTGHGYGTPADQQRAGGVDQLAFVMWGTKMGEACANAAKTSQ